MVFRIENDYGTLSCKFNGICVCFCDNLSNECFSALERKLLSLYGVDCKLDYVLIDCDKVDVKIFVVGHEGILPLLTVSFPYFFRNYGECDLLRFVNIFSRKRLHFVNGRAVMDNNRNYLRLSSIW